MKTVVISDIHGCSREFGALLKKAQLDHGTDRLVILGDLFDRGERAYEVYKQLRKLQEEMGERFILVRGNHDQFLLDYVKGKIPLQLWAMNGCMKTMDSFKRHGMDLSVPAEWLADTPLYWECGDFIGVHAGLISEIPGENDPDTLLWDRSVTYGAYTGRFAVGGHTPLRSPVLFLPGDLKLEMEYGAPFSLPDRGFLCIDTGCVYGRMLTALIVEDGRGTLVSMKKLAY